MSELIEVGEQVEQAVNEVRECCKLVDGETDFNAFPGESRSPVKDWRSTLGMFAGDPVMKEIIEDGHKIRERDREQAAE